MEPWHIAVIWLISDLAVYAKFKFVDGKERLDVSELILTLVGPLMLTLLIFFAPFDIIHALAAPRRRALSQKREAQELEKSTESQRAQDAADRQNPNWDELEPALRALQGLNSLPFDRRQDSEIASRITTLTSEIAVLRASESRLFEVDALADADAAIATLSERNVSEDKVRTERAKSLVPSAD